MHFMKHFVFILLFIVQFLFLSPIHAESVDLDHPSETSLGTYAHYYIENNQEMNIQEAITAFSQKKFSPSDQTVPHFGIGSNPAWIRLPVVNGSTQNLDRVVLTGVLWLDYVDIYIVRSENLFHIKTGDHVTEHLNLIPAVGFAAPFSFPPGESEVYIRTRSIDPVAVPISILTADDFEKRKTLAGYFYAFFFGFMCALCIYNLLLFSGLKEMSYLYYSLALGIITVCNFSYTGHGIKWVWTESLYFQQYFILILMLSYNVFGVLFGASFLSLSRSSPTLLKGIYFYIGLIVLIIIVSVLFQIRLFLTFAAFTSMTLFSFFMFYLGLRSIYRKDISGRYFFLAVFFGMIGICSTSLSVTGIIPFHPMTFHAGEIGMELEATLLALALSYKMRRYRIERKKAVQESRLDSLTGLYNRRAFQEAAEQQLKISEQYERPLSAVMIDIDHFKSINDRYGHLNGDEVLVSIAGILGDSRRSSDILARWGGEEFVLLLPETEAKNAAIHCESLRSSASELSFEFSGEKISLTASFGIAEFQKDDTLESLIENADRQLYRAKKEGRNRVCY